MVRVNYWEKPVSIKSETNDTAILTNPADDPKKNLILAMAPDRKVVGVKFAWKRPEVFEDESECHTWLQEAYKRVDKVCKEIMTGHTLDKYGDMLDTEPKVTKEILSELENRAQYG